MVETLAKTPGKRWRLFSKSTRVYGDYFVKIGTLKNTHETVTKIQSQQLLQIQLHYQRITAQCPGGGDTFS